MCIRDRILSDRVFGPVVPVSDDFEAVGTLAVYRVPSYYFLLFVLYDIVYYLSLIHIFGKIDLKPYLEGVELVVAGGESDMAARPLDYRWVLDIREQCIAHHVHFEFRQCGTHFIKDGKTYRLNVKDLCSQAKKAGINV